MKTLQQFILESLETKKELNGFVILKPGFTQYEDDWKYLLNKSNGWDIIQCNKVKLTPDQASELYSMHKEKDFFNSLCEYMSSDECICCACHKDCDDPIKEMNKIKDKVREKWGINDMKNGMHSSDSLENVDRECKICLNL